MRCRLNALGCALRIGFTSSHSGPAARRLESDLLIAFEKEHGQLPPYNKQRALDLLSRIEVNND